MPACVDAHAASTSLHAFVRCMHVCVQCRLVLGSFVVGVFKLFVLLFVQRCSLDGGGTHAFVRKKSKMHTTPVVPGWSPTPVLDRPKHV
jgi:hypothetical protein